MSKDASQIKELLEHNHCVNCGMIDPEMHKEEAHTKCCNESLCRREEEFEFGNEDIVVKACCWAVAERRFKEKGIDVNQMDGIRRFKMDGED